MLGDYAALIGLAGVVLGALLTGLVKLLIEERRRYHRETELVIAVHAEIVAGLERSQEQTTNEERSYANKTEDPFGVPDDTDLVVESIKRDPGLLPASVIHVVVRYYKLAAQSNAYTKGLSDPVQMGQSSARKKKYKRQLFELVAEQERIGLRALNQLELEAARRGLKDLPAKRQRAGIDLPKSEA